MRDDGSDVPCNFPACFDEFAEKSGFLQNNPAPIPTDVMSGWWSGSDLTEGGLSSANMC